MRRFKEASINDNQSGQMQTDERGLDERVNIRDQTFETGWMNAGRYFIAKSLKEPSRIGIKTCGKRVFGRTILAKSLYKNSRLHKTPMVKMRKHTKQTVQLDNERTESIQFELAKSVQHNLKLFMRRIRIYPKL